jgi:D-xylose transport system substrate-binding protein
LAKGEAVEGAADWTSPSGTTMTSKFLAPVPVTADNLSAVLDAGWIEKDKLCAGSSNAACN